MGRRVALLLEGSRGDAQPYVAAALALKDAGYEILIIGDRDVADLAKPLGTFLHDVHVFLSLNRMNRDKYTC